MPSAGSAQDVRLRRPGPRIAWIALGLLAIVLTASLLIRGESPATTILIADLPSGQRANAELERIRAEVERQGVDLVLVVAPASQPGTEMLTSIERESEQPWLLIVSRQGAAAARADLASGAQVANWVDGKIQRESTYPRPQLVRLAGWTLALLAIGALAGRLLLPRRPTPPTPPIPPTPPTPPTPPVSRPAPGRADRPWWSGPDAHSGQPRDGVDLQPFQKRSAAGSLTLQCPHCAAFDLLTWDRDGRSHYRCQQCGEEWQIRPGAPWPTVVIRPRRRRAD